MRTQTARLVLTIALALATSACGNCTPEPTETRDTTSAIVSTDTPEPRPTSTPTLTPVPLSHVSLEPLLIQSGDLPAGLSGAQVRNTLPEMFDYLPTPDNAIYRQFERDGDGAGGVTVILYEAVTDADAAYAKIVDGFGESATGSDLEVKRETLETIGQGAEAVTIESEVGGVSFKAVDLAFVRCYAVVHIRMTGTSSLPGIESYAKRLDERLSAAVCR